MKTIFDSIEPNRPGIIERHWWVSALVMIFIILAHIGVFD